MRIITPIREIHSRPKKCDFFGYVCKAEQLVNEMENIFQFSNKVVFKNIILKKTSCRGMRLFSKAVIQ